LGGLLVGTRANRVADRTPFTLTAATLVILAGGLGCSCAGSAGLAGIALGVLVGAAAPGLWRAAPR
jgi:hypothetical protein